MKKISIVIPVYNEEDNLILALDSVKDTMGPLAGKYDYEIIFTDNHSEDRTFPVLKDLARKNHRIKVARFSRNFGYQRSIYTGLMLASGDAVVQLDCDLQDPTSMISEFIKKWEDGYSVVYGIRITRKENFFIQCTRKLFYRLIDLLSEDNLPHDAGDFRLIDKKIVEELRQLYDYSPYVRGMIASMGFEQVGIPYHRQERISGKSKFNLNNLVNLAMDGLINHSFLPLRLAAYTGLLLFVIASVVILGYVIMKFFFVNTWPAGFTTITTLILISIGLNALFLGIIGEYLGRIYQQVKKKPISIIEETINFKNDE